MTNTGNDTDDISDGYHTFGELYSHRNMLFIVMMTEHPTLSWYSTKHDDGTEIEGFFIAGMHLPIGQVTYHMRVDPWLGLLRYLTAIPELPFARAWDGHDATDTLVRLQNWLGLTKGI